MSELKFKIGDPVKVTVGTNRGQIGHVTGKTNTLPTQYSVKISGVEGGLAYWESDLSAAPAASANPKPKYQTADSGKREEFSTGSKRDTREGKGRFDLIPAMPLLRLAQLYERGAAKYDDNNWKKGQPLSRYLDSAMRHLVEWMGGDRSEDHLTSVVWNCFAYQWTEQAIEEGKLPTELNDIADRTEVDVMKWIGKELK